MKFIDKLKPWLESTKINSKIWCIQWKKLKHEDMFIGNETKSTICSGLLRLKWIDANINEFFNIRLTVKIWEYEAYGNNSPVIVQGIVSNPIIEKHTYSSKHITGTQSWSEVPSLIHFVNVPDINMTIAIPIPEIITSGLRLNRFNNQAFKRDIMKRVTPTKIETVKASTLLPISYWEKHTHCRNKNIQNC